MNIIVLAGGLSTERNVSLSSGASICKALNENGHHAYLVDAFLGIPELITPLEKVFESSDHGLSIFESIGTEEVDIDRIKASRSDNSSCFFGPNVLDLCKIADITFIALHGDVGENGKVQATFDLLGISYTGPNFYGCALSMDKNVAKKIFSAAGVPSPKGFLFPDETDGNIPNLNDFSLSLPVVVKPNSGGSSIGVSICQTSEEYILALEKSIPSGEKMLVEEFISGREFTVCILDNKALPIVEIIPKSGWFDYKNKYQEGMTEEVCPADLPNDLTKKMQALAEKAFAALKLDIYSRADFLLTDDNKFYCLEVNSLPGMTTSSLIPKEAAASGISYNNLCEWIIDNSLKRFNK